MSHAHYRPPRWLHNPHLQSLLSALPARRRSGRRAIATLGAVTRAELVETPAGVRLQGWYSEVPDQPSRGLAVLLHGWEGSSQSSYMQHTSAHLLAAGFEVFRLDFRDHGDSHHLNPGLFHSCRLEEVQQALLEISRRHPARPLVLAGFSLGGNFALRLALTAPAIGLALRHVAAVCPAIDPSAVMRQLETGSRLYHWYFMRKWRRSLLRKRALFAEHQSIDDAVLALDMRQLTQWLVQRHTDLADVEAYFDGYSVAGQRLAALQVPVSILATADDPVIPADSFAGLPLPSHSRLEMLERGGHCAFIEGLSLRGYAERWVSERLCAATTAATPVAQATMNVSSAPA